MTMGNVGSLLVFDPSKISFESKAGKGMSAASDSVMGIITERGGWARVHPEP